MLIIHIIPNLQSGGAQRHLLDVLKNSPATAPKQEVITINQPGFLEPAFQKAGLKVTSLNKKRKGDPLTLLRLVSLLKKKKPALVVTHLFGGHLYGRLAAKLAGIKIIVSREDVVHEDESLFKRTLKKYFLNPLVKAFIANSAQVKQWLVEKEGVPAEKITVIQNGLDLSRFSPRLPSPTPLAKQKAIIIGTVATPKKQKGLYHLIRAFQQINRQYHATRLWLVGGAHKTMPNNEEPRLKELVKTLGLNQVVTFWGSRDDVPNLLQKMDIFVLPSLFEGFGIVILEAWAAGLPVISSRLACIEEYATHQKNIHFVPPGNNQELAAALKTLIIDDKYRQSLAKNGQEQSQKHAIPMVAQKYTDFLLKIIHGN